ncbi:TonB-linked outer membrane protein, SusC/RagA family [Chitinophaga terrae (ex Kim and Jung 2007)]|uniref:TonB-linked outer membrane protein, SusC/RagA family n=1 Tax=Chitinophaga terrae (ex Kim and Jung 2007) TaxID=408074 RepID=A0A1H4A3P0_9BACT|nr:SusC/RagA family TonB-linked outer membrane protein [Chitinophaga terrae (ex Kim and Jung 2007)]MDQ0106062.1 TonB-linked SusC/RagA family outer membrane protein [Chitinophaga terrae (ex Kim and Jung 2007)]SEA30152.1 TonB-linked outer membrane protein, SusC/RagA family [Chitinophaga terrae (ex Kim and Jung 2007)]
MRLHLYILLMIIIVLPGKLSAQNRSIHGTVKDAGNQSPLPGVSVAIKGTSKGVTTDASGKFQLEAPEDAILVFSFVGYDKQEIPLQSRANIDVRLQASTTGLNEVVVTALGIERKTRSLGYSTQQLDNVAINTVKDPGANIMNTLNGKVAGAVITPAASGPGSAVRVVLRGNRSISGNNNALIVVDGVPIDNTMSTEKDGGGSANAISTQPKGISSSYAGSDGAATINPQDVESVNILKGPAAAALYGSRAANGAIIITTKSGRSGKLAVNYNGGVSLDQPYMLMKFQDTYGSGNGGQAGTRAATSWGAKTTTYPGNVRSFFNTGVAVNNSVDISGGNDKLRGYASYTNNSNSGIIPKNRLNRNTLNVRVAADVLPRLTADVKLTYVSQEIKNKPRLGDQGVANEAYLMPRDLSEDSLKKFEGIGATGQPYPIYWTNSSTFQNPYWDVYRNSLDESRNRIMLMGSAKYKLTDWLSLQGRYSLDRYDDRITASYYFGTVVLPVQPGGRYLEAYVNHWERNMDVLLSGNNKISGDFHVSYNLGGSLLNSRGYNTQILANGLSIPNRFNLAFATAPVTTNTTVQKEIQSVYGNAQLDFRQYLYLDVSARNDWSSTLPKPYSYFYPAVGLSAVVSDIFKLPEWVSFGKVRAAYTQVGNDASPYMLLQLYNYNVGAGKGFVSRDNTKAINNLKPEQTKSYEAGLEWKFFDNRLGIDATIYKNNTINQLLFLGLPLASGFDDQYINAGNVENKGLEIMLNAVPVRKADFNWNTAVNFATNKNTVLYLKEGIDYATLSSSGNFGRLQMRAGGKYGDIYGFGWQKDEKTGQYLIGPDGLPVVQDNQYLGNFNPKYTLGWNNQLQYKNFSLSFLLDGRVGGIVISGTDALLAYYGVADYTTKFRDGGLILPGVKADGSTNTTAITAEKLWTSLSSGGRDGRGQFFAFNATNFRLRELSLAYDFDFENKLVKHARLSFTGRNLFFLYRGKSLLDIPGIGKRTLPVDPESALGTSNYQGIEAGLPPALRSFGLNLQVSF